ncbi:hypothetical protein GCM10007916_19300 [Psychromonas marina]|uniref:SPOR domain-containing protein n=1 Tax=Psychromonas marina TaxID=88364 RepID=A0ABQ6E0X2_9GAMM|nr:AAA family ATPase [Psychromonas marina]GLS90863.1 hypothetical protein GCM10007916_19300 [Psychromonas marina]
MYQEFFSLNQQPFSIAPDPEFLFFTEQHKEALAHLNYGLQGNGGFVVLTGELGTGKTSVCRFLLQDMPTDTDIAWITNTAVSEIALLVDICEQFSVDYDRENITLKVMFDALASWMLANHQAGRHAIVLIDEAQHLSFNLLEQLRLITNIESDNLKPLQIILVGQTELQQKLLTTELRQLSQRITARYHLRSLNKQETTFYIYHRLNNSGAKGQIFDSKSVDYIFKASLGNPRLINQICDRCLLSAYTQSSLTIGSVITKKAINEIDLPKRSSRLANYTPHFISLISILLVAFVINNQSTAIANYFHQSENQVLKDEWLAVINMAKTTNNRQSATELTAIEILHAIPENRYSLQLATLNSKKRVIQFFEQYPTLKQQTYLYQSLATDNTQYVVLLGNFESYRAAKLANKELETTFPNISPWIKDYKTIHRDIK